MAGDVRVFWLENEGNIAVEDSDCVGVTLGEDCASMSTEGGLEGGEVT